MAQAAQRTRTVAHAVGETLAALGVDVVFGLVGSGNLVATNALVAGGARYVAARHEGGAVGMADGWSRVTGRVGVVSVHQGPGLTNTLTALTEAAKNRSPLLVLAGDTPAAALRSNFRIDQHDLVASVGALPDRIRSRESAPADAARALRRAAAERRPVVLMMPIDLQAAEAAPSGGVVPLSPPLPLPPAPAAKAIAEAAQLLARAERPAIIGGRGAVLAGARDALEALGEQTGALMATSAMAAGLFAGLPYDLGIAGGFATPLAAELLRQSDAIVSFGASLNHWTTRHGDLVAPEATVIQVDLEADALGAHRPIDLGIVGDARATAEALAAALGGPPRVGRRSRAVAADIAGRRWADEPFDDESTDDTIDPRTLSLAIAGLLPEDRQVAVDSGHLTGWPAMYLGVTDPRAWLFANAYQAVGLGLGCALGAAVARPDRVTVAALGDGGAFLSLAELETAARLNLRVLVLIYDDAAYGAEVHHFGPMGEDVGRAQFPDADLAALGRAAGGQGITVRSVEDLDPIADWVRDGHGPLVVDAKVNPNVCADWLAEAFRAG